jgi:digeranylgeranylglycerophospholipid reductase
LKVAIIGGGFAGIVCATQLERLGIIPDIFERNNDMAEPYRQVGAALQIVLRPIKDPLQYLNQNYDIDLKPSGLVKKIVHKSPTARSTITGNLGYFLHRGAEPDSIDNQLAKNLKSKIFLNMEVDFKALQKEYDYVVIATGHPFEAKQLGIWQETIKMSIKGTVIKGNFKTNTFKVWLNKDYCKSGYAYLAPFSSKEATLALAVDEIELHEIDKYWDKFIKSENLNYKIKKCFTRMHYSGFVYPHKLDNLYFIGNAGGVLDPLLGFGVFPSVVTASEAANSIVHGTDYESRIKEIVKLNLKLLEYRKVFNILNNKGFDLLVKLIGLPGVNSLVYNTNLNALKLGYLTLKPLNSLLKLLEKD